MNKSTPHIFAISLKWLKVNFINYYFVLPNFIKLLKIVGMRIFCFLVQSDMRHIDKCPHPLSKNLLCNIWRALQKI